MGAVGAAGLGRRGEAGMTLYVVAGALVLILGLSALAVDLVAMYVARNEAQRSADAAALAGAQILAVGCTSTGGCSAGGPQETPATTQAVAVASQNSVFGQAPSASTVSTSFSYPNSEEPQITVTVHRDAASGNAVPTFFAKIFGFTTMNVSATATAEAYNPSGGSTPMATSCLRPFLVPNCDPAHPVPGSSPEANSTCPTVSGNTCTSSSTDCQSYFFDPNKSGALVNPGAYNPASPAGSGVVGEPWSLHTEAGPSQWYLLGLGTVPSSGSQLEQYIENCSLPAVGCYNTLNTANGKKVGPTDIGINTLINASGDGPGNGQDTICSPTYNNCAAGTFAAAPPFPITGGARNPNPGLVGQTFFSGSSSIASVAVYDGHQLPPGGGQVTVVGLMQMFIVDAIHSGTDDAINSVIMAVGGCGTTSTNPPPVTSAGGSGSFIPIRLIHQ